MKNPLTILVVEDDDKHYSDFEEALGFVQGQVSIELRVQRARTLQEGFKLASDCDACITDAIFPAKTGEEPRDHGHMVANEFLEQKKAVVVCTSGNHHGADIKESYYVGNRGVKLFDCEPNFRIPGRIDEIKLRPVNSSRKPWLQAIYGLLLVQQGLEDEVFWFEEVGHERSLMETRSKRSGLGSLGFKFNQIVLGGLCRPNWDEWFKHFKNSPGELEECQRYKALVEKVAALGAEPPANMRWTVTEE